MALVLRRLSGQSSTGATGRFSGGNFWCVARGREEENVLYFGRMRRRIEEKSGERGSMTVNNE